MLTTALTIYWWRQGEVKDQLHFNELNEEVVNNIQAALQTRIALLQAATGTFAIGEQPTAGEFHRSMLQLKIRENYPSTQGIGYSVTAPYQSLNELEGYMKNQGFSNFS